LKPRKISGRKRKGVKYEAAGQKHFASLLPSYLPSPWFHFADAHGTRYCQPDGIAVFTDFVLIVEFKYQHTLDAWAQLRLLYQPVVELVFRRESVVLEVVKWYDCAVAFPEPVRLVENPAEWRGRDFGVHIWSP
jgi:hypothetical protein